MENRQDRFVGTVVDDRYQVRAYIACGGMATVYQAYDARLERKVALKIMHPYLAQSPEFVERFRREARAAAGLTNPGIVAIYDQGTVDGLPYLVMEYVVGDDLRTILRSSGPAPLGTALQIIDQTLTALASAHEAGLVHRDLKPENILLDTRNAGLHVKVADFGLARAVTEATMASTDAILGTVSYLAPELVTQGHADARADVYACGIILYELITGQPPFQSDVPIHVAYQHVNDPIPLLQEQETWIPAQVDGLIAAITAKDPANRPANAARALQILRQVMSEMPAAALEKIMATKPGQFPAQGSGYVLTGSSSINDGSTQSIEIDPSTKAWAGSGQNSENWSEEDARRETVALHLPGSSPRQPTVALSVEEFSTLGANSSSSFDSSSAINGATSTAAGTNGKAPAFTSSSFTSGDAGDSFNARDAASSDNSSVTSTGINPADKPKKSRGKRTLAAIFLTLALGGSGAGVWYFNWGPGAGIPIPAVAGLTVEAAESKFAQLKLKLKLTKAYSDTVPVDHLIAVTPTPGSRVAENSTVTAAVSLGVEMVKVPSLRGETKESALAKLSSAKLRVGSIEEAYDNEVPKDQVIAEKPGAGTEVIHDSAVTLIISKGREPVTVPNLDGLTKDAAVAALTQVGLNAEISEQFSDTVPAGTLISSQAPTGQVYKQDTIKLVVSKGPELVQVPNVVGSSKNNAVKKLQDLGFKVTTQNGILHLFGLVSKQSVSGGQKAPKGSTIILTID